MSLPVSLDEDGALAPPRSNGELAFGAPWESRLFGLTMTLVEAGRLDWEAFRGRLVDAIGAWEGSGRDEEWDYWRCWQVALEDSLEASGLVALAEIDRLTGQFAARPHGHDHDHHHASHRHEDHDEGAAVAAGRDDE